MLIKDIFLDLQSNLALSQYPGRQFRFGIPAVPMSYDPQDHVAPGLFLDWSKGRFIWEAAMCGGANLKSGDADFNALIAMEQKDVPLEDFPGLLPNEALAIHMLELGETLITKVLAINATEPGYFANPMVLTHSFIKDEPVSLVNLLIRVSHFATGYQTP